MASVPPLRRSLIIPLSLSLFSISPLNILEALETAVCYIAATSHIPHNHHFLPLLPQKTLHASVHWNATESLVWLKVSSSLSTTNTGPLSRLFSRILLQPKVRAMMQLGRSWSLGELKREVLCDLLAATRLPVLVVCHLKSRQARSSCP